MPSGKSARKRGRRPSKARRRQVTGGPPAGDREVQPSPAAAVVPPAAPPAVVRWLGVVVVVAALVAFAQTLTYRFTLDDVPVVEEGNRITSLGNVPQFFRMPYWEAATDGRGRDRALYRPVTVTTFALNYAVHGRSPAGYHLVNVLLHAAVSLALFAYVRRLGRNLTAAFAAALLFAVHPVHAEAVAGIVGRAELLALLGILLCGWTYLLAMEADGRSGSWCWRWGMPASSVACYALGMFSKETGIIAPAVILAGELLFPQRRFLLRGRRRALALFAGYGAAVFVFLAMRSSAIGPKAIHEALVGISAEQRVLTGLRICLEYVGLLAFPLRLSADYTAVDTPLALGVTDIGVTAALVALLAAVGFLLWGWRRLPLACWGLIVFAMALFPVSNLPFAVGILKAERVLYSPSAGFLAALAAVVCAGLKRPRLRAAGGVLLVVAAGLLLVRTWVRNPAWKDSVELAKATLETSPHSTAMCMTLAKWHRENGRFEEARTLMRRAVKVGHQPEAQASLLFGFGNLELEAGNWGRAADFYRLALELQPADRGASNNLGRALMEAGRLGEAADVFDDLRHRWPDSPLGYANLVSVCLKLNDPERALPVAEDACRRFPRIAAVHLNASAVYHRLGRQQDAAAARQRALALDPKIGGTQNIQGHF